MGMDDSVPLRGRCRAALFGGVVAVLAAAIPAYAVIPAGTSPAMALGQPNSVVKSPGGSQTSGTGAGIHVASGSSESFGPNGGSTGNVLLPEPASVVICAIGCGVTGFALLRRRRLRKQRREQVSAGSALER
jgi:hypothetical protein